MDIKKKNLEKKIIEKLSKILSVKKNDLIKNNDLRKLEKWDSLKHLEIITVLDKLLKNKLKKVKNPNQLTTVKKIISLI